MRYSIGLLVLVGLAAGCGERAAPKTKTVLAADEVPAFVTAAARKKEPDVNFNKVIKTADGIYEVQGKNKAGKILEVEVNEKGDVVNVE